MKQTNFLTIRFLFLLGLYSSSTIVAFSQSQPTDSAYRLEKVEVVASRFKEIIPAQQLSGEELERLNSLSVADAIRYFSGVQIKDYGGVGGLKTINVRSMGTNHMGVFYNDIQLGNAQNGQVDLGKFSLDNLEEIALYNGQKSEIFQTAREFGSAGSIYLTTRKPRFAPGKDTNLRVRVKAGSFGLFNPSLLYEYKISDQLSTTFNAEWVNANGKYKFRYRRKTPSGEVAYDTTAVRKNGDIDAVRFEGGIQGNYHSGFWKAYLYHYSSERGVPGAIVNNVWCNGERLWDRNSFVQGVLRHEFSPRLQLKLNLKYAYDYTHYVNEDSKLLPVDTIYKQREAYASAVAKYEVSRGWEMSVAYDFQWNELSEHSGASRGTHWVALATAFTLADRLKMQASMLATIVDEKEGEKGSTSLRDEYTPAVFLSYQPFRNEGLVFRAFCKRSFRMPTFNDLYYTERGSAPLKPEHVTQYNIGTVYDLERPGRMFRSLSLGANAYYNKVKDKIVTYPGSSQFRWTTINLGKVDIRGVEAHARATLQFSGQWAVTSNVQYTFQRAIDVTESSDSYYRHQIPYIPRHSGSAVLMVSWRDWFLNYSYMYVGERYSKQENIPTNYVQPWYTSDLSLIKTVRTARAHWKFTVEVNNLFSQDYDVVANYPMPKRSFRLGVGIDL